MSKVGKFLKGAPYTTRGEAIGLSVATGVGVGTTNAVINQHYVGKAHGRAKNAYYTRRLKGQHGVLRKGGANT